MDIFNIRDLKERPGALVREAEKGHLSLITKHGHPICVTVPFSQEMIQVGLHKSLALSLLKEQQITLRQAAKLAGVSLEEMMDFASISGVAVVDYDPKDLARELTDEL